MNILRLVLITALVNFSILYASDSNPSGEESRPSPPDLICADELAIEFVHETSAANHLVLGKGKKKYLMGSLIRTESGRHFLAVGGYRNRHRIFNHIFTHMRDIELISDFKYLWGGELLVERSKKKKSVTKIIEANETWGFLREIRDSFGEGDLPSVLKLEAVLRESAPHLIGNQTRFTEFSTSPRYKEHLMKSLNEFKRKFKSLVQSSDITDTEDSWRHFLINRVFGLLGKVEVILSDDKHYPKKRDKLAAFESEFESPLVLEALSFYVRCIANDRAMPPEQYRPLFEWVNSQQEFQKSLEHADRPKDKLALWKDFAERAQTFLNSGAEESPFPPQYDSALILSPEAPELELYRDVVIYELERENPDSLKIALPRPEEIEFLAYQ